MKSNRKQITFDTTPDLHKEIKLLATRRNISINLWMHRAIMQHIKKERKYDEENEANKE